MSSNYEKVYLEPEYIQLIDNILNLKVLELQSKGYDVSMNTEIIAEVLEYNINVNINNGIDHLIVPVIIK